MAVLGRPSCMLPLPATPLYLPDDTPQTLWHLSPLHDVVEHTANKIDTQQIAEEKWEMEEERERERER